MDIRNFIGKSGARRSPSVNTRQSRTPQASKNLPKADKSEGPSLKDKDGTGRKRKRHVIEIDDDDDDSDNDFDYSKRSRSKYDKYNDDDYVEENARDLRKVRRSPRHAAVKLTANASNKQQSRQHLKQKLEFDEDENEELDEEPLPRKSDSTANILIPKSSRKRSAPDDRDDVIQRRAPSAATAAGFGGPGDDDNGESRDTGSQDAQTTKRAEGYRKFLNRSGPPNKGQKELPVGARNCLEGNVFAITGVLDSLERDECADLILQYGGRVVSAVSKKVTHGVVGTDAGETKLQKLKQFKTLIIDEDGLFSMISATAPSADAGGDGDADDTDEKKQEKATGRSELPAKNKKLPGAISKTEVSEARRSKVSSSDSELWVERYKPTGVEDLVANPKICEQIGSWLRNWRANHMTADVMPAARRAGGSSGSDEDHPALLLCGPPGIGKTSAACVICRANGYEPLELNASDVRNKNGVSQLADSVMLGASISMYLVQSSNKYSESKSSHGKNPGASKSRKRSASKKQHEGEYPNGQVLIMDEVDGMSSGDRGGSQELIKLFKRTRVPIICICNDDSSQKMRTLGSHCYKLKFRRPMASQVRDRLLYIAKREGFHAIDSQTAERLAEGCHGDIRQMINLLQTWRSSSTSLSFSDVRTRLETEGKTFEQLNIFEVFPSYFASSGQKNTVANRMDNFYLDSDLMPLFVAENYLNTRGARLSGDMKAAADAAEAISDGDLCNSLVRREQRWDLMPPSSVLSCVLPGSIAAGGLVGRPMFPSFLGNMSKTTKNKKLVRQIEMRMKAVDTSSGSARALRLDYAPALMLCMATPLIRSGAAGIPDVIERLDAYYFQKDDWNILMEIGVFKEKRGPLDAIPGVVKSALTREYNKLEHSMSTVSAARIGSKGKQDVGEGVLKKAASSAVGDVGTVDDDGYSDDMDKDMEEGSTASSDEDVDQFRVKAKGRSKGGKSNAATSKATPKPKSRSKRKK